KRQPKFMAELHGPRLARHERVGARIELETAHLDGGEAPAHAIARFEHDDTLDARVHQAVRHHETCDPASGNDDTHDARCSRTTAASTSQNAGSAFGISVRA